MAYSDRLAHRVRQVLDEQKIGFVEKQMMGGLCIMVDGKMCVGVNEYNLMLRIGPDAYDKALTKPGCREMDFTGRPMKGYVFVDDSALATKPKLRSWLKLALDYNPIAKSSTKRKKKATKRVVSKRPKKKLKKR